MDNKFIAQCEEMPLYKHSCKDCTFIGTFKEISKYGDKQTEDGVKYFDVDVYVCLQKNILNSPVMLRYSDDLSDESAWRLHDWIKTMFAQNNVSILNSYYLL